MLIDYTYHFEIPLIQTFLSPGAPDSAAVTNTASLWVPSMRATLCIGSSDTSISSRVLGRLQTTQLEADLWNANRGSPHHHYGLVLYLFEYRSTPFPVIYCREIGVDS